MLVLHPTSCCDICLDDYTWVTPANSPHAIACGHVFCLVCLHALNPSTCPLCRKTFQPDRVKKLHVDKAPDDPDGTNQLLDSHTNILLQRLALVSGESTPDSDVAEVITDVMEWFETQSDDLSSNRPLRAAVDALRRYKAIQDKYNRKKTALTALRTQFSNMQRNAEQDLKTSQTVEQTLLAQLEEVKSHYTAELEAAEVQIESLHNQMARYKNVHNPLPPPPQPLPLDRFPSLGRHLTPATSHPTITTAATNAHYQLTTHPTTSETGRHVDIRHPGANGSAHTRAIIVPSRTSTADQMQLASHIEKKRAKSDHRSRQMEDTARITTNGEGSSRNRQHPQNGSHTSRQQPASQSHLQPQPQNKYPYIESDVIGPSQASQNPQTVQQTTNNRARIIPGASPTQRVIPPPVRFMYADSQGHAETDWETEVRPRDQYGRQYRHHDRRRSFRGRDEFTTAGQPRGTAMVSASDGEIDDVQGRLVSASAFVAGYGSGYNEGFGYASTYRREYVPEVQSAFSAERLDSSENSNSGLGLIGIPGNMAATGTVMYDNSDGLADVTTLRPIPTRSRHMSINSSDLGSANLLAVPAGGPREGSRQTLEQVLRVDAGPSSRDGRTGGATSGQVDTIGRHSMTGSVSSWGTVNTSARGSMSDLGLIGLHRGGVRGQGSVAEGSQFTPLGGSDAEGDADEDVEAGTPRVRRGNLPLGFVEPRATRPQADDERPRHLRSVSYPEPRVTLDEDLNRPTINDDAYITRPHQQRYSLAQSVSLDSGALPPSVYRSQSTGNALALTFEASAFTDDASVPFTANTRGVSPEQIRAPAPRVGGPNVLNLWRSGA